MPCVAEVVNRSLKAECTDFTQSSYGPEPNPDMYAVSATIRLMFGQEYGRANLLLLSTQIRRLLASESKSEFYTSLPTCPEEESHLNFHFESG